MSDFDDAVQNSSQEIYAASEGVAEGYAAGQDAAHPGQDGYGETTTGEYTGTAQAYHDAGYAVGLVHGYTDEYGQQHPAVEPGGNWGVEAVQPGEQTEYPYGGEVPNEGGNWGVEAVQPGEQTEYPYGGEVPNEGGNWGVEAVQPGEQTEYPYGGEVPNQGGNWGFEPL